MTLKEFYLHIRSALTPVGGSGEAKAMAEIIIAHLKGFTPVDIAAEPDREISDFTLGRADEIISRVTAGEPLQYVIGSEQWHGLTIKVTPDVLIPRPETSELVDIIVDRNAARSDLRVLDLCTGSGCIAVALARNLKFAQVTGVDISEKALDVARENAAALKVNVKFCCADVLTATFGTANRDIIVSNPPYVLESEKSSMDANVLDHEPAIALFVPDSDSIRFYSAAERIARQSLTPGGQLYFELNPLTAVAVAGMLNAGGWQDVTVMPDIHGRCRFLSAIKPS